MTARLIPGCRVCGRYTLAERIGEGGHGDVWRALDGDDGSTVALKVLRPELANSAEAWAVLQHESSMARRLDHPGILRTGRPLRDGDLTLLPMEYAGGGDLKRLRGEGYLRTVPVLIKIAEVLAHAHERGVVHRDLKPGNVLFDERGGVRLADFGAAGLQGSTAVLAAGSPFSASPQQLRDEPAASADDIYGLGALAYDLLSGQPPFYPDFAAERVLHERPADLASTRETPPRLTALVMAMLAKDPQARPATMLQVIEALNLTLSDTWIASDPVTPPRPPVRALPSMAARRRRRAAPWLLLAAIGIVTTGLVLLLP